MITWSYTLAPTAPAVIPSEAQPGEVGFVQPLQYAELGLDSLTGDLPAQPQIIRGAEAVAQRIRTRFRFFLGEWFLDQRLGMPYYSRFLVKNPDLVLITNTFRQALLDTPGVASVRAFTLDFDRPARILSMDFEAQLENGAIIVAQDEPFILP
jgi:hypothetical protein